MLSALMKLPKLFSPPAASSPMPIDDLATTAPDIWKLEMYMRQLIFVPDDLKYGGPNHQLISESSWTKEPLHPACYTHSNYTFWKKDLGDKSYPVVLPENYRPSGFIRGEIIPAPIKGELWAIRPSCFRVLDKHRNYGVQFIRDRVPITYPYREIGFNKKQPLPKISDEYFTTVTAWMYIGIPEYWDPQIGGIFQTSHMDVYEHDVPKPYVKQFYKFEI